MDERFDEQEKKVLRYMVAGLHSKEIAAELGISESKARTLMQEILLELGAYEGATRPIAGKRRRRPRSTNGSELLFKLQHQIRRDSGLDPAGLAREVERREREYARLEKFAEEWRSWLENPKAYLSTMSSMPSQPEFTAQELGVLELAAKGMTTRDIADKLGIDRANVDTHLTSIFGKLHRRRGPGGYPA
jgi:DNA-binding NarL/FixJ family response regulator